ncbi:MAG: single-stranded DNA-binding protein [Cyanobacteria bacterium]|nr:single-stranded DNA-binding protein [Cyanobacteria bacterium GSL.Bin21]
MLNQVTLTGTLGKASLRQPERGKAYLALRIAQTEEVNGTKRTEWFNVRLYVKDLHNNKLVGMLNRASDQYAGTPNTARGLQVTVSGKLCCQSWTKESDNQQVEHIYVMAREIVFDSKTMNPIMNGNSPFAKNEFGESQTEQAQTLAAVPSASEF